MGDINLTVATYNNVFDQLGAKGIRLNRVPPRTDQYITKQELFLYYHASEDKGYNVGSVNLNMASTPNNKLVIRGLLAYGKGVKYVIRIFISNVEVSEYKWDGGNYTHQLYSIIYDIATGVEEPPKLESSGQFGVLTSDIKGWFHLVDSVGEIDGYTYFGGKVKIDRAISHEFSGFFHLIARRHGGGPRLATCITNRVLPPRPYLAPTFFFNGQEIQYNDQFVKYISRETEETQYFTIQISWTNPSGIPWIPTEDPDSHLFRFHGPYNTHCIGQSDWGGCYLQEHDYLGGWLNARPHQYSFSTEESGVFSGIKTNVIVIQPKQLWSSCGTTPLQVGVNDLWNSPRYTTIQLNPY